MLEEPSLAHCIRDTWRVHRAPSLSCQCKVVYILVSEPAETYFAYSIQLIHHASSLSYVGHALVQCRAQVPCIATAAFTVCNGTLSWCKRWLSSKASAAVCPGALLSLSTWSTADTCGLVWCNATCSKQATPKYRSCYLHGILFSLCMLSRVDAARCGAM